MVIDEIQRLPSLTLAIKAAIDEDRRPGRFILTGSSSLLRVKGTADSRAGRSARLDLFGLSRGELAARPDDFADEARSSAERAPDFSTVTALLDSDRAMSMLRVIAGRPAAELVKAKLAEETSTPARTVTSYVDLLHDVGLVASIPPWTPNLAKREVGRSKTFVIDSALATRLARVTPTQLARIDYGEAFGSLLEAFVAAELLRQRTWSAQRFELFHYRDRDGTEVDLVLEFDDGSVIGIEVKAASSHTAKQFRGLQKLRDALGEKFIAGIVLATTQGGYRYAPKLDGLPIAALWEWTG